MVPHLVLHAAKVPASARSRNSCRAGHANGLGGLEARGGRSGLVELFEGDAVTEEVLGIGEGLELLVGGGDVLLAVVDADEAGAALGVGPAADADGDPDGAGLVQGEGSQAVVSPRAEVVDVAVGDAGEALEAPVAVDFVLAAGDLLGGGSGEPAVGGVDLGQEGGVLGRIAPLEGVGRGLAAAVADVAGRGCRRSCGAGRSAG
ncbi:hypothetical protein [Candidatus Palauibacter sp.]|uniref:hypothetical protein n=1 Tax=Candidatus Palauibacter sp. TaxID=3101350 RepID=UPI003B58DD45